MCIYIYVNMCIYANMYICISIYVYICIYTCTYDYYQVLSYVFCNVIINQWQVHDMAIIATPGDPFRGPFRPVLPKSKGMLREVTSHTPHPATFFVGQGAPVMAVAIGITPGNAKEHPRRRLQHVCTYIYIYIYIYIYMHKRHNSKFIINGWH